MSEKRYDDDDGRVIADMSDLPESGGLFLPRRPKKKRTEEPEPTSDEPQFTKKQRNAFIGGALSATMLIAGIFIAAGAIVIFLMTLLWH